MASSLVLLLSLIPNAFAATLTSPGILRLPSPHLNLTSPIPHNTTTSLQAWPPGEFQIDINNDIEYAIDEPEDEPTVNKQAMLNAITRIRDQIAVGDDPPSRGHSHGDPNEDVWYFSIEDPPAVVHFEDRGSEYAFTRGEVCAAISTIWNLIYEYGPARLHGEIIRKNDTDAWSALSLWPSSP